MKKNVPVEYALTAALALFCACLPWSLAAMQIALGLVVLAAALFHLQTRTLPTMEGPFYYLAAIYLLLRIIATAWSPEPLFSVKNVFLNDWPLLAIPFLVTALARSRSLKPILYLLFFSATLAALYGCVQFFTGVEIVRGKALTPMGDFFRAVGGYNFYLTFAANQMLAFALLLAFFLKEPRRQFIRGCYALAMGIIFLGIMASFARSVWLALLIVIALSAYLVNRRLFFYSIFGFGVLVFVAALLSPEIQGRVMSIFDPAQNEGRFNLWKTSWNMIRSHPLGGIGTGMFNRVFDAYKVPGFYDAFGHSHNDYLNTAVNSGIPAALAWVGMWLSWGYQVGKSYRTIPDPLRQALVLGSLTGIAGILFAALFQCYYTDLENNIFWCFCIACGIFGSTASVQTTVRGHD